WYHVVGTYNGSMMALYINGVLEAWSSETGSVSTSSNPLTIGSGTFSSNFVGLIDELTLRKTSLSADEIETIYNNQNDSASFWTTGDEENVTETIIDVL